MELKVCHQAKPQQGLLKELGSYGPNAPSHSAHSVGCTWTEPSSANSPQGGFSPASPAGSPGVGNGATTSTGLRSAAKRPSGFPGGWGWGADKSFIPGRRGWPSEGDGRGGCREESVTSDPRKALSRCLGQEKAGQAGTAVTLKLAQPLHMPQEATASTCLPQLCTCTLSWHPSVTCLEQLGTWGLLPSALKPSLACFLIPRE